MIINTNTLNTYQDGKGEGYYITPEILLWRSVIVRAIMDALDIDIHAWGLSRRRIVEEANAWFNTKDPYFIDVCENANMSAYWVNLIFNKIKKANVKKLFKSKNSTLSPTKRRVVLSNATAGKQTLSSNTIGSPRLEATIIFSLSGITPIKEIPKTKNGKLAPA